MQSIDLFFGVQTERSSDASKGEKEHLSCHLKGGF